MVVRIMIKEPPSMESDETLPAAARKLKRDNVIPLAVCKENF